MNQRAIFKLDRYILSVIFILSICIPFFSGVIESDDTISSVEKRVLAELPLPPTSLTELSGYPLRFNAYYSDHFGFREILTKEYFKILNRLGNTTFVDDVTVGQDGWLFLGSIRPGYERHNDPIGDAINANLFKEDELREFATSISETKDWLNDKGIEYVYVIAPNKHSIYFEKLPKYIKKLNDKSSTDQLVAYLRAHTTVSVVDLRQALLNEKLKHQVYFRTDTHWNSYGANVAQFEIMKTIIHLFPGQTTPFLLDDNQFKRSHRGGGDLAVFAKIEKITEDNPVPVFDSGCVPENKTPDAKAMETHTMVCGNQGLKALIFHDSFFEALKPFISRQFYRSTYVWEKINYPSLVQYVEQEKPDIVVEEVVERSFPYVPKSIHLGDGID
ncbi:MAG: hypothetical protein HKP58_06925 [Desulfatitalea sp.]|nr:hypothetical protein [Desulfatitalea sp.]NNK00129.1 hypothetical protein [Desulfatitalea sp.]